MQIAMYQKYVTGTSISKTANAPETWGLELHWLHC